MGPKKKASKKGETELERAVAKILESDEFKATREEILAKAKDEKLDFSALERRALEVGRLVEALVNREIYGDMSGQSDDADAAIANPVEQEMDAVDRNQDAKPEELSCDSPEQE